MPSSRFANKGRPAELIVSLANRYYREMGIAVVQKVPTAWLPLRGHDGRIYSAKVEQKSIVDFVGQVKGLGAIAFDCKANSQPRWRLALLEEHQLEFLRSWRACGGVSFILLLNVPSGGWHLLTLAEYERFLAAGARSISQPEIGGLPRCFDREGCVCDYLGCLERISASVGVSK